MSERRFRAVVAAVLVGALVLLIVVTVTVVGPRPSTPSPRVAEASPGPSPTLRAPTPTLGPVFGVPGVVSVGQIARGTSSGTTLVLTFIEPSIDAIPNAPGSFRLTLADQSGDGSRIAFVGTPVVGAPGSLGATATLVGPNILLVSIAASDTLNIEPITITGLGIRATSTAPIGSVSAELDGFTGSLASGAASNKLASPGSVVAGP